MTEDVNITGVKLKGDRPVPHNTHVSINNVGSGTHVHAAIKLPWRAEPVDLGLVPIVNGEAVLPLTLVFLCHAKEDREAVQELGNRLLGQGVLVWFDEKDLLPGDDWEAEIEMAIEGADFILVFLSPTSCAKTGYVQREVKYALKQRERRPELKRYIIPILLEPCQPPRSLEALHQLRLWEPDAYDKLLAALGVKKPVAQMTVSHGLADPSEGDAKPAHFGTAQNSRGASLAAKAGLAAKIMGYSQDRARFLGPDGGASASPTRPPPSFSRSSHG